MRYTNRLSHKISGYSIRNSKTFYPKWKRISPDDVRNFFCKLRGKMVRGEKLIREYGLEQKVFLEKDILLLSYEEKILIYLIKNNIHPRFYATSLHSIGTKAAPLKECVAKVELIKLNCANLARALKAGAITRKDTGENFALFKDKNIWEKLEILVKLGVIVLEKGASLPVPEPKMPVEATKPQPPTKKIDRMALSRLPRTVQKDKDRGQETFPFLQIHPRELLDPKPFKGLTWG